MVASSVGNNSSADLEQELKAKAASNTTIQLFFIKYTFSEG
jgi:hypothetical protein